MIPQQESILAICEFLGENNIFKVNGEIPINTVRILFKHVLDNAFFVLQLPGQRPKYFKQIRGGPMGSECTQVLADIYMRKWEKSLREKQIAEGELYFRFRDDIFLTTKKTKIEMNQILEELGKIDKNIGLTYETGKRFYSTLTGKNDLTLLLGNKHSEYRDQVLDPNWNKKPEKKRIDFNNDILAHFTYTPSLSSFGAKFHSLWNEILEHTPLSDISVIFAHKLTDNLKNILVHKKPSKSVVKHIVEQIQE
ncbi:unnamed protein product [Adineta steineri]|uniref:Reverse transcriptase domain-containing protein n=1 Tax=Adineta steineri TaxID=433720 RepID=A0A814KZ58_9BILA|nr:unnamed protein product [Adineta steineri]CAF1126464.1 unnamed protein product [Adineta steineri]